jgi:hypothetical protein
LLDNAVLKDLLGEKLITPAARFAMVERVIADQGYSERRARGLIGVDRSSFQYCCKTGADAAVGNRLKELTNERRRFGYRRLAIMAKREGVLIGDRQSTVLADRPLLAGADGDSNNDEVKGVDCCGATACLLTSKATSALRRSFITSHHIKFTRRWNGVGGGYALGTRGKRAAAPEHHP